MYKTSQLVNINVLMITSNLQFAPVPIPVAFHEIRLKCSTKAAITMRCVFNPSLLPTFVHPSVPLGPVDGLGKEGIIVDDLGDDGLDDE